MTVVLKDLSEMIERLPRARQTEVRDFVEFLLTKSIPRPSERLRQSWAGALRDYRDHYSPLDLQKEALRWRTDECT